MLDRVWREQVETRLMFDDVMILDFRSSRAFSRILCMLAGPDELLPANHRMSFLHVSYRDFPFLFLDRRQIRHSFALSTPPTTTSTPCTSTS